MSLRLRLSRARHRQAHPQTDLRAVYAPLERPEADPEEVGALEAARDAPLTAYPPAPGEWRGVWSRPYGDRLIRKQVVEALVILGGSVLVPLLTALIAR